MTTKTYTISDLCRLLGIENKQLFIRAGSLWTSGGIDSYEQSFSKKVLSVGDTIPSEECECMIKDGWEGAGTIGKVLGTNILLGQSWTPVLFDKEEDPELFKTAGLEFKPLLLTVKAIRMVETCKCGHLEVAHGLRAVDLRDCKGYEPEQRVEIETEG